MDGILLNMIPEFYTAGTQLQKFNQLFVDQPIQKDQLLLTIPEETFLGCSKTNREIIERYLRNGIKLVLDDFHPGSIAPEELIEIGLTRVRVAPDLYLQQETANAIIDLRNKGFTVYGGHADTPDVMGWLIASGVECSSGTMTGFVVNEDEMILDSLNREQN